MRNLYHSTYHGPLPFPLAKSGRTPIRVNNLAFGFCGPPSPSQGKSAFTHARFISGGMSPSFYSPHSAKSAGRRSGSILLPSASVVLVPLSGVECIHACEVHIRWNVALLLLFSCSTRCDNTDVVHARVRVKGNSVRFEIDTLRMER